MDEVFIYGTHAVTALFKQSKRKIYQLIIQEGKTYPECIALANAQHCPIHRWSKQQFQEKWGSLAHQGIVAEASPALTFDEKDLLPLLEQTQGMPLMLILDGITDPHNLGACLRTADAAHVTCVILPKDNSAGLTATVSKVAAGALESVPLVTVTNLARSIRTLQKAGLWIYGASEEAPQTLWQLDFKGPTALVMGSEGAGLRRLTKECCDALYALPMLGQVESLNVSVAAGISLYEVLRQRR